MQGGGEGCAADDVELRSLVSTMRGRRGGRDKGLTAAASKKRRQICRRNLALRSAVPISPLMMGKGPASERPTLPKKRDEVTRRPAPRGYAASGIV